MSVLIILDLIMPVVHFIYTCRLSIRVDVLGVILVGLLIVGEYPPLKTLSSISTFDYVTSTHVARGCPAQSVGNVLCSLMGHPRKHTSHKYVYNHDLSQYIYVF